MKKMIKILTIAVFTLLSVGSFTYASSEQKAKAVTGITMAGGIIAMSKPAFVDRNGNTVIDARTVAGMVTPANGQAPTVTLTDAQTNMPVTLQSCVCNDSKKAYRLPPTLTLIFTNATGAAVLTKYPSFDTVAEAVGGSLGAAFATLKEAPNGAGTIANVDGTLIYGITALAKQTASYALAIGQVTLSGSGVGGAQVPFNIIAGSFQGNDVQVKQANLDTTNISGAVPLYKTPANDVWYLTANKYINISVPANSVIQMEMAVLGWKMYDELL